MAKRVYLTPVEVEAEMNEKRKADGVFGEFEQREVKGIVESAKRNNRVGDQIKYVVDPKYIHIPEWQRKLKIADALVIGAEYESAIWEEPKVLYVDGILKVVDGMHRVYGTFVNGMDAITVTLLFDMTEERAIDLFLDQTKNRRKMSLMDTFDAALKAGKREYVELERICKENKVCLKGHETVTNPIGVFTSISDGIRMARTNPELLDKILKLIGKLQWNGSSIEEGKAYSAKVVRVLQKLYAYNDGKEKEMEDILIKNCKGAEYFEKYLAEKWQDKLFDHLANVLELDQKVVSVEQKVNKKDEQKKSTITRIV